ncbi:hypothetical protein FNAPI_4386 [Fusarium napiforme]|uniref:F-box domain-containing protein n=1 Tax=Fusarium napiforme TaxID=42672 RepID=A0A8H5JRS5_9HYPO|nr:hypothetical protein FNAPI_4386 [Fusarium napiforme]
MAGGHAKAAGDIPRFSMSTRSRTRCSGYTTSRLPTEIYQMIVNHIVLHYDRCNDDQKAIRAKTLSSLARTSRTLQCLTEPYIYSFPEGSRLQISQGLGRFQQSLAADSRRANLVQVLDIKWDTPVSSRRLVIDIARRCPNLCTLHLSFPEAASRSDEFGQTYVDNLADLFFACPKVRKLRLATYCEEALPIPAQDGRVVEFAGQLSHVEVDAGGTWFHESMLPYLSPNVISFVMINPGSGDHTGFLKTLGQRCPVLQRLKIMCRGITLVDLAALCKALGSTLKVLYLRNLEYDRSVLSLFLPHMQVLEHLYLGNNVPLYTQDLDSMSSLSHLRTFIADGGEAEWVDEPDKFFYGEEALDVYRAVARFLSAHMMTLETMWIDACDCALNEDVFESLKLVRNLRSVGLDWCYRLKRKEVVGLLEACPKLQEASDIHKTLEEEFGDEEEPYGSLLWIEYPPHKPWFENDFPHSSSGWSDGLRQPQLRI